MENTPPRPSYFFVKFGKFSRAFTLVEMLVVIAIIVVLAVIAIPVISRMQKTGLTTKSTNNLRQIYTMLMHYQGNNESKFPNAIYNAGEDPNGYNDGIKHYWRRAIWEAQQGPLGNNYNEKVANLTKGPYSKTMWCPLQVSKHGMSKIGFLEGHGSYAINKFFYLWDDRFTKDGVVDIRRVQEIVRGKQEPLIVAGTSNGDLGTYPYFESTSPPQKGVYDAAPWCNMAYDYGSSGNSGLAVFLNGNIELIPPAKGTEINSLVKDHRDFE